MKKILFLLSGLFFGLSNAQEINRIEIEKNIIAYRLSLLDNSTCYFGLPDIEGLIPNHDQRLIFSLSRVDRFFPRKNYQLYEIETKYSYSGIEKVKTKHDTISNLYVIDFPISTITGNRKFLIGIDTSSKKVIFIAGDFFKNCIADDFDLSVDNPNSFYEYLKFKLHDWDIEKVRFSKNKRKYLLFKALTKDSKEVIIKVMKYNFDNLQIKVNGQSVKGTYKWLSR